MLVIHTPHCDVLQLVCDETDDASDDDTDHEKEGNDQSDSKNDGHV